MSNTSVIKSETQKTGERLEKRKGDEVQATAKGDELGGSGLEDECNKVGWC
jgi:hypothetical protein